MFLNLLYDSFQISDWLLLKVVKVGNPKNITGPYGNSVVVRLTTKDRNGEMRYVSVFDGEKNFNPVINNRVYRFKNLVISYFPKETTPKWLKTEKDSKIQGMILYVLFYPTKYAQFFLAPFCEKGMKQ